jgi:hypothetical protein
MEMKTILLRDISNRKGQVFAWVSLEVNLPFIPNVETTIYHKDYEYVIKEITINLDSKEIQLYIGSEFLEAHENLDKMLKEDYFDIGWIKCQD